MSLAPPFVQAQRREAWGELPTDPASSVENARGLTAGRLSHLPSKPNAVRRGANYQQTPHPAWFGLGYSTDAVA